MCRLDLRSGSSTGASATAAVVTVALALGGCASAWSGKSVKTLDTDLGVEPSTVPSYVMRPDGLMINGLLPEQHGNEL